MTKYVKKVLIVHFQHHIVDPNNGNKSFNYGSLLIPISKQKKSSAEVYKIVSAAQTKYDIPVFISSNKKIKKSQLDDETVDIFSKIEHIFIDYPSLFPDDSFQGVTKASTDIIDNRDVFNALANEHAINAGLAIESVKAEDIDQLKIYFNNLYSSCKSCHSRFRN